MTTDDDSAPLVEEGERLSKEWKKMKFVICRNILESKLYLFIFDIFFISFSPSPPSSLFLPSTSWAYFRVCFKLFLQSVYHMEESETT